MPYLMYREPRRRTNFETIRRKENRPGPSNGPEEMMRFLKTDERLAPVPRVRKKRVPVILLLVSCLVLSLGQGSDLVLCFGDDGHVELESSSAKNCCAPSTGRAGIPENAPDKARMERDGPSMSSCGPCLDISLDSATKATLHRPYRDPGAQGAHPPSQTCPPASLSAVQGTPGRPFTVPLLFSSHSAAASLRTTILQI